MIQDRVLNRQRFIQTLGFKKTDRVPLLKEGIRAEVVETWQNQGLGLDKLEDIFHYDDYQEICLNLEPDPEPDCWPRTLPELELYVERLDPDNEIHYPKAWTELHTIDEVERPITLLRVHHGFFLSMGVYDWERFLEVMYLIQDDPDFVCTMMNLQGEFSAQLLDRFLAKMSIDAALFSEPIGGNDRPLLPPDMYEAFVCSSYRPIFKVLDKYNVTVRILRTYANIRVLIPTIIRCGFNCLWACETNIADMDYQAIRQEFGTALSLIGGIDLDVLRLDTHAIRAELYKKIPALLDSGGYIPLADGRVRTDVHFQNYAYYRCLLEQLCTIV
ncbi:hypothetical protein JXQ70_07060 [bacterium]|nr:hypothetical protein [bacterium]